MSIDDVKLWIDSYNRWVEVWNKHETSKDLPLNPEWPEASKIMNIGYIPRSVLAFVPKGGVGLSGPVAYIRLKGWRDYHKGWSMCRNPADIGNVVWAGWRRERQVLAIRLGVGTVH